MFHTTKFKSFPHQQQPNAKDCGATCLKIISEYYGKKYSLKRLREYSCISREGASLMCLSDAAERIGFTTLGLCPSLELLRKNIKLPCILFWKQGHYVVCYKIKRTLRGTRYYISDPASMKHSYNETEFKKYWYSTRRNNEDRGIALSIVPTSKFYELEDDSDSREEWGFCHYFSYLSPHKMSILMTVVCMALLMLTGIILPFLTQALVDVGIKGGNMSYVVLILLAQLIISLTNMIISMINSWVTIHTNTRVDITLGSDFWRKILKLPVSFFDKKVTGDIMERIEDYERIKNFLLSHSINFGFAIANFIIYTCILAIYNVKILIFFLLGNLLQITWSSLFLKSWKKLNYENFEVAAKNNNRVLQMLQGIVDIKLNNEERQKRWEWEKIQANLFRLSMRKYKLGQLQDNVSSIITSFTNITISVIIAKSVIEGEMTLGMMMAIAYLTGQIGGPINFFIGFLLTMQDTRISLERLKEITESEDDDTGINNKAIEMPEQHDIYFNHVDFSYDGSERTKILFDVSLKIPEKKVTAIVGNSGSGKTTIIKLMQGLYTPTKGEIMIGNMPLNNINPHALRDKVGSVMQDSYIFSDTIARNIATGTYEINKQRLYEAAKIANIEEFINNQPLGYNLKIGMEGVGVSQGQRQRILIARAVYKSPEIMIFDEATNALDSCNENIIMTNLQKYFMGRTVVIAAHRLSTIRKADQIIVMKDGRVSEIGTHEELLANYGEYYKLVENQL